MPQINVTMEQGKGYEIEHVVGPATEETITLRCVIESKGGILLVKETADNNGSDDEIAIETVSSNKKAIIKFTEKETDSLGYGYDSTYKLFKYNQTTKQFDLILNGTISIDPPTPSEDEFRIIPFDCGKTNVTKSALEILLAGKATPYPTIFTSDKKLVYQKTDLTGFESINAVGKPIDFEYLELKALADDNGLEAFQPYRITDYETIHLIPGTAVVNTGGEEPLIIVASSANSFFPFAKSEEYPHHIILYDFTGLVCEEKNRAENHKGFIYRRIDTVRNVDCCFDFINAKFRRYNDNFQDWSSTTSYQANDIVRVNDDIYIALMGGINNNPVGSPEWKRLYSISNIYHYSPSNALYLATPNFIGTINLDLENFLDVLAIDNTSLYHNVLITPDFSDDSPAYLNNVVCYADNIDVKINNCNNISLINSRMIDITTYSFSFVMASALYGSDSAGLIMHNARSIKVESSNNNVLCNVEDLQLIIASNINAQAVTGVKANNVSNIIAESNTSYMKAADTQAVIGVKMNAASINIEAV